MKKKRVLVFGTFDGLHRGHISFLRQARKYGDFLIGVVARDGTVEKLKGRRPVRDEKARLRGLREYVDMAVMGEKNVTYNLIKKLRPDVICIGYDQKPAPAEARNILKRIGMSHVRLKKMRAFRPRLYKSSKLNKPG